MGEYSYFVKIWGKSVWFSFKIAVFKVHLGEFLWIEESRKLEIHIVGAIRTSCKNIAPCSHMFPNIIDQIVHIVVQWCGLVPAAGVL